ncbi:MULTISPECIES: LysR family transcriptional regulator [Rhizobium]|uniref:DNA-binding transcriptional LysR family regulator n=1 Tax=Rhizobium tropici TaxID=398 RepID=A0A6P1CCY6_RHITR|nr:MULTISPECIES: LysR family transcriptional regulator [Rhizobium]AGB75348.1 putative LysR family transcriptional regulator [Rhizobium tropici CIAT 899]MBB4241724.1 DNA-binding transcriptional LysR family regulator [Rhizobium tropici]MBB5593629.1 DNA-binding transcriptional LysR family regulator [Rhizobium tropici]MBB6492049.1 DNA-binding transcriptional LysR family regulator [Rhizobium tropici]NEV13415.1 LysR family transcriptional regulator [Rhizobium tropici]
MNEKRISRTVPLKGLQAFEAVGRCGSVSAAALELKVSPGAISQQIRKIESFLGVTLLERNGRTVELTQWGRLYHLEISKGFEQFAAAEQILERARNENALVLSALSSVVNKWIGRRIFDWQTLHPNAHVRIVGRDKEPRMGFDDIDFRISYGSDVLQHEHYTELFRDWVVPACSPALIKGKAPSATQLLQYPLLHVEWERHFTPYPSWLEFAAKTGAALEETAAGLSFTLSSSAIDAAVNKRGIVLAQMSMIADELEAQTLVIPVDIRIPLRESYFLAWDRAALEKPYGRQFRDWLVAISRQQGLMSARGSTF